MSSITGRRNSSAIQSAANLANWHGETLALKGLLPKDKPMSQAALYSTAVHQPFQQILLQFRSSPYHAFARTQNLDKPTGRPKGFAEEIQEIRDVIQMIAECVSKVDLQQQSSSACAAKRFEEVQAQIHALEAKNNSPSRFTDHEIIYNSSRVHETPIIPGKSEVEKATQRIEEQKFREYIIGCMKEMEQGFHDEKEKLQFFAAQIQDTVRKELQELDLTLSKEKDRGIGKGSEIQSIIQAAIKEETEDLHRKCENAEYGMKQLGEMLETVRNERAGADFALIKSVKEKQEKGLSGVEDLIKVRILEYARRKEDSDGRNLAEMSRRLEEVAAATCEFSKKLGSTIEIQKLDSKLAAKKEQNAEQYVAQLENSIADFKAELQNESAKHSEMIEQVRISMQAVEGRTLESCTALSAQVGEVEAKLQKFVELIDSAVNKAQLMYQQKVDRTIDGLTSHLEMTRKLQDELASKVDAFGAELRKLPGSVLPPSSQPNASASAKQEQEIELEAEAAKSEEKGPSEGEDPAVIPEVDMQKAGAEKEGTEKTGKANDIEIKEELPNDDIDPEPYQDVKKEGTEQKKEVPDIDEAKAEGDDDSFDNM